MIKETVRKLKTGKGLIQMLTVTERQFENMEFVLGKKQSTVVDTAERLVVL